MNLTDTAFIELLAARKLVVRVSGKKALDSLRVMLYRKLQAHIKQWDDVGYLDESLRDATISVDVDKDAKIATLFVTKRRPRLQFTILTPSGETSNDKEVPADLGNNQEGQIWDGSSYQDPSQHGEDIDSSCPQGESNGQCSAEEDWESKLRAFVEQNSDTSNQS